MIIGYAKIAEKLEKYDISMDEYKNRVGSKRRAKTNHNRYLLL